MQNSNKLQKVNKRISPELESLKKEIAQMQGQGMEFSTNILEKTKVRDIGEIEETISGAMNLLRQMSVKDDGKTMGFMKSLLSSLPFSGKVKAKYEQTVIENKSMKESVDDMHNAVDNALKKMTSDLEDLFNIYDSISGSLEAGKNKVEVLRDFVAKAKEDGRRMDAYQGGLLLTQVEAVNYSNGKALESLEMQIKSSEAMSNILGQVLPVIKPTLLQQAALAVANINNQRVHQTMNVLGEVINELAISNKKQSQEVIKETFKQSNRKIIDVETIKKIDALDEVFFKDIKQLALDEAKRNDIYNKELTKSMKKLSTTNNQILMQLEGATEEDVH